MGRVIKKTVSSLGCIKPAPTLISALLVLAVGVLVALLGGDRSLFSVVNKPAFTPPAFVFPIVWTVIYLLIGGAAGAVLARAAVRRKAKSTARCSCLRSDCCLIICGIRSFSARVLSLLHSSTYC